MTALAVVAALDGPVLLAIVLAGLTSVTGMVYEPAAAAITPETVPETELAAANALRNMVDNIAIVAGPLLGALILLVGPPPVVFLANAASFALSAVVVSRMSVRSKPVDVTEGGTAGPLRQMLVGMRAIATSVTAAMLVTYSVIASFVYGVDTVQFVVLSEERLGTGADGYGYLLAGLGVGGIAAAGLVNRIASWPRLGTVILAGMALYCLPTLLFLVVDEPAVAFVIQGLRGAGTLVVDVLAITALQRSLPSDLLARVFGAYFTFVSPGHLARRAGHPPGDRGAGSGRQPVAGRWRPARALRSGLAVAAPDGPGERRTSRRHRTARPCAGEARHPGRRHPTGPRAARRPRGGGRRPGRLRGHPRR